MDLNEFAKSYICLGLRINKHIDGYVEHYYGPPELKKMVDIEEKRSPKKLLKDYQDLEKSLPNQGFEQKRYRFLSKTLTAVDTILRILNGESFPYLEQSKKLFDMKPVLYDDAFFLNLSSRADKLYKGEGTLTARINAYAKRRTIPSNMLKILYLKAIYIAQMQTKKVFHDLLPDKEEVVIKEVENQKWAMYNWYLGNYKSRIEIDINKIHFWTDILHLACHEAYPGHHTERSVREKLLFHNKNYFENLILLIYTPEMVISEGIGEIAEFVIFDPKESIKISLDEFCLNLENEDSLDVLIEQSKIKRGFRRFPSNLAYYKHVKGWKDEDLLKYSRNFDIIPENAIQPILNFISDDLWAPYSIIYQGERLITEKFGYQPSPKHFKSLLTNQTLPSDLT